MPSVTVRPIASGNCAYLHGFRGFSGTGLSVAYRPVPARLQYGCSSGYHSISPRHTPLVLSFCTEERYHYSYKVLVLAFVSIELIGFLEYRRLPIARRFNLSLHLREHRRKRSRERPSSRSA
jgi:hypothetical protein